LVFIVVVALFLSGFLTGGFGRSITIVTSVPANSVNATTTVTASTVATVQTTSVYFSACQSGAATVAIPNGNFSTGTYYGWNAIGPGFGTAPFNLTRANTANVNGYYGAPWSGYSGNYFATTYAGGLSLQAGNLTSLPFEVTEPYLNFRIISPQSNLLYIEILQGKKTSKYWYNTYNTSNSTNAANKFVNASIPLLDTTFFCQNVSVRVVSGSVGTVPRLNYIAVGDFYMSKTPKSAAGILVNESLS
jgi:hypothetical protein